METRIAENIRAYRKQRGLTQEQLADAKLNEIRCPRQRFPAERTGQGPEYCPDLCQQELTGA